jgi:hypothetical protein
MYQKSRAKRKPQPRNKIGKRVVKSDFEWSTYHTLKAHKPKGSEVDYETEKLEYILTKHYVPDFIITFNDGTKMYIECKGYFKYPDREKMISVKENNPDLDIRFVFYRDNPGQLGMASNGLSLKSQRSG